MRRLWIVAAVAAALALPIAAAAADKPANYLVLKGGLYSPQSDDLDDIKASEDLNVEIAYGRRFGSMFGIEIGVGYFQTDGKADDVDPIAGNISIKADTYTVPVTINGKLSIPLGNIEIYGLAGVGAYFVNVDVDLTSSILGTASGSDDDMAVGFQLGLGASFDITKNLFVGVEGKYLVAEASLGEVADPPDVQFDGILATANLGFRF